MTNTTKKITKREQYAAILNILDAAQNAIELDMGEITYDTLSEFINDEIRLLDNKAAKAKERAAAKKVEGDALREDIYNVLSDTEYMTINDIVKALDREDVTPNMVTARLTQLVSPEIARVEKDVVSVPASGEGGKSKKLSGYRRLA